MCRCPRRPNATLEQDEEEGNHVEDITFIVDEEEFIDVTVDQAIHSLSHCTIPSDEIIA